MGMSDNFLLPTMSVHFAKPLMKLRKGARVAWLGQRHPEMQEVNQMYGNIKKFIDIEFEEDFYDLHNDATIANNSFVWDVNTEWDLSDYDAIVAARIFYACESASQLLKNIENCLQAGQVVIADFMSGNSEHYVHDSFGQRQYYSTVAGGCELLTKPAHSKAILPMFPSVWEKFNIKSALGNYEYGVKPNHEDQVISEQDFLDRNIGFTWIHAFREPTKHRIYTMGEFTKL